MKQVLLVRHAKSDWDNPALADFDRPLSQRGKADAPLMAHRLLDKKTRIDAVVSSPAKRAFKTAKIFAKAFEIRKEKIMLREELYLAEPGTFYEVIEKVDNKFNSIAVFSHNNGITDFANLLTETRVDNIPTCGVFALKADCTKWKDFRNAKKGFLFFDYPKAIQPQQ